MLHRTTVAENLASHSNDKYSESLLSRLLAQGTDPLKVVVDRGHAKHIEVFCSMRMNDTHDAANANLRPRLKNEHPEYLNGSATKALQPANVRPSRSIPLSSGRASTSSSSHAATAQHHPRS